MVVVSTLLSRVAEQLGRYQAAAVSVPATGPDPGRWLISASLHHDSSPDRPSWVGGFVHFVSGAAGSYRVATEVPGLGLIGLDQQPALTATPSGTVFELSWPLPMVTTQGITGLLALLGLACRAVWFEDFLAFSSVAGAYTYDLTAYRDWLDDEARVARSPDGQPLLLDPSLAAGYPGQPAPDRFDELRIGAGWASLRLKRAYLASGGSVGLGVIRPAYSLVNLLESTVGPTAVTDQLAANGDELVEVTLLEAYRYLGTAPHLDPDEQAHYASLVEAQQARVAGSVRHYLPSSERGPHEGPQLRGDPTFMGSRPAAAVPRGASW